VRGIIEAQAVEVGADGCCFMVLRDIYYFVNFYIFLIFL